MDEEDALNVLEVAVDTALPMEEKNEVVTNNQDVKQMMEVEGYNKNYNNDGVYGIKKACDDYNLNGATETKDHMEIKELHFVKEIVEGGIDNDRDGTKENNQGVDNIKAFVMEEGENLEDNPISTGDFDEDGKYDEIDEVKEMEEDSKIGDCAMETKDNHLEINEVVMKETVEDYNANDKDGSKEENEGVDNIRNFMTVANETMKDDPIASNYLDVNENSAKLDEVEQMEEDWQGNVGDGYGPKETKENHKEIKKDAVEEMLEDSKGDDNDGAKKKVEGADNVGDLEEDGGNMKDGPICSKDLYEDEKVDRVDGTEMDDDSNDGAEKSIKSVNIIGGLVEGAEEDMEDATVEAKGMVEDGKNKTIDRVNEIDADNKDVKIDVVKVMDEDIKVEVDGSVEMCKELKGMEGAGSIDREEMKAEMVRVIDAKEEEKNDEKVDDGSGNDKGDIDDKDDNKIKVIDSKEKYEERGENKSEDELGSKEQGLGDSEADVLETKTGLNEEACRLVKEKSQEDTEDEDDGSKEKKGKNGIKDGNALKKCEEKDSAEKSKQKKGLAENTEKETRTPVTSVIERPVRERKTVERLVTSIEKDSTSELRILKGHGTPLKDIPNVTYKLSRRKVDDTLKLLHMVLFGRRAKAVQLKSNISRFSGFVWHENDEKHLLKVKEKLDKINKEKLWEICDVLDISVPKSSTRKEDIVVRLLDFLMEPHATTTTLHADKEQSSRAKKRKRVNKSGASRSGSNSKSAAKDHRNFDETSEDKSKSGGEMEVSVNHEDEEMDEEDNSGGFPERCEAPKHVPSESKEMESDGESDDAKGKVKRTKRNGKKKISAKSAAKKSGKNSSSKRLKVEDEAKPKVFSRKSNNLEGVEEKSSAKSTSQEKTGRKRSAKGKPKVKGGKTSPSSDELRSAICEILKEVDFNTATFTDILNQLGDEFKCDLSERKASIKLMIQDELTKLADEADEDEDEDKEGE